ncbi:hypothetical protein U9M48_038358 [Paspalum notatum var. saurae]|uniref:Reverse transcriptase domain-containing protein n=1 Tax=Paspalum notatum var. saurae TaxID=547442 RepID=A0AAQ3UHE3_PASNO
MISTLYKRTQGVSGGVLLAVSADFYTITNVEITQHTVSVEIQNKADNDTWSLTGVYGPQGDSEKIQFLAEIKDVKQRRLPKWTIMGDFNLIFRAEDKNNSRINRRLMGSFKSVLDELELKEIKLHGRKFTWSSETTYWVQLNGFLEVVQQSWSKPIVSRDPVRALHIKLARLGKALKAWNNRRVCEMKNAALVAQEVISFLDQAQENRQLTETELALRRMAKQRILGLAALRKIKIRQRARLIGIRVGDANTKLFHLRANGRRRKNFIPSLRVGDRHYTAHQDKAQILHSHFSMLLGSVQPRQETLNWGYLQLQAHDLQHLDDPLTEQEVHRALLDTPQEKAPGPDGFIGMFYKKCWHIIKADLMKALKDVFSLRSRHWNLLNSANISLIPKHDEPQQPQDYRPISLTHSVAKLLSKVLANRLAPHLDTLISKSQSAFIKGRNIHDNFQYVRGAIKHFHSSKTPMLFIKLDIAKAFDSVRWEYLLELMQQLGFGQKWRDLISYLWASTTSRILLNGALGHPIQHRRGLRQGDPLSPMLFILAMDPIQRILDRATQQGLLTPIGRDPIKIRTSLYADDAALFVRPIQQDLENLQRILDHFGAATGLKTNIQKTSIHKIRCENIDVEHMLQQFGGQIGTFPRKFLGLPLHYGRQRRTDEQVLIDKIGGKLAGWKGRLLTRAGRLTLVQSVLGAIPTYHMTVFNLSKWAVKKIDRLCRSFLWKGSDDARGGHCLVNWRRVNRSKALGGLGIKDLQRFNRALRIKWLWTKWKDPDRPWAGFKVNCTEAELDLFRACTQLWLQGLAPKQIAPSCFNLAWRKNITVAKALQGNTWMRGFRRMTTDQELRQFVKLWRDIQNVHLSPQSDSITWRLSLTGEYTAKSAYDAQFFGSYSAYQWEKIWKAKVEPKCRFFMWLLLQQKILTSDKILRRGGQANPICQLCRTEQESALHMVANCSFAKLICSQVAQRMNLLLPVLQQPATRIKQWWLQMIGREPDADKARYREQAVIYLVWNLWKERCRRLFDNKALNIAELAALVEQNVISFNLAHVDSSNDNPA